MARRYSWDNRLDRDDWDDRDDWEERHRLDIHEAILADRIEARIEELTIGPIIRANLQRRIGEREAREQAAREQAVEAAKAAASPPVPQERKLIRRPTK